MALESFFGFILLVFIIWWLYTIQCNVNRSLQELKEIRKLLEQRNQQEEMPTDQWPQQVNAAAMAIFTNSQNPARRKSVRSAP